MTGKIVNKRLLDKNGQWVDDHHFFVDGKEVTEAEFLDAFPDQEINSDGIMFGHRPGCWPMIGDATAVHPKQVEEARARNKRHGVNVDYLPNGRAVIPDAEAYKKLRRLEGYHFNNGYES